MRPRTWADLLEGEVVVPSWSDGRWHSVHVDGEPVVGVQLAPDHEPPTWPDPAVRQQVHLDLEAAEGFRAYADPAGQPFCLTLGEQA